MQFTHTMDKVLSGEKTLTSRLVKPGEFAANLIGLYIPNINAYNEQFDHLWDLSSSYRTSDYGPRILTSASRTKWQVGATYAVQPGRGKPAVARIRILAIKRYDVREITTQEVIDEGFCHFLGYQDFWTVWCSMHDKAALPDPLYWLGLPARDIEKRLHTRPAERYQAWQLRFELVK